MFVSLYLFMIIYFIILYLSVFELSPNNNNNNINAYMIPPTENGVHPEGVTERACVCACYFFSPHLLQVFWHINESLARGSQSHMGGARERQRW